MTKFGKATTSQPWTTLVLVGASLTATLGCPPAPPVAALADTDVEDTMDSGTETNAIGGDLPRSCTALTDGVGSDVYRIDPDGAGGDPSFEVFCDMETMGGGWILVGKIAHDREIGEDAFDWDLDLAALRSDARPTSEQYAHLDMSRLDSLGSAWTFRAVVYVRTDLAPKPDLVRYTFFRPMAGEEVLPGHVGINWGLSQVETRLELLVASNLTGADNVTWIPAHSGVYQGGFHLFGQIDRSEPEFNELADCLDDDGQSKRCFVTAGMLDADANGTAPGAYAGSSYADGYTGGMKGVAATYWLRDERLDHPQTL